MGKYKFLAKNSLMVFIGNIGSKLIGFLMLPFYTTWLSVDDYGASDLVSVYVSLLLPFVSYSLTDAIFVFPAKSNFNKQCSYFTTGLFFVLLNLLLVAGLFFVITSYVSWDVNVFTQYVWYIYMLLISSFFQTYFQQFCMALDKMYVFSFTGVLLAITTAIFGFFLIPRHGIHGYLVSLILANLVTLFTTIIIARLYNYIDVRKISRPLLIEMLKYSVPLIPNSLMWWLIASFNRVTLETYAGVYYIGLYAVANKVPGIMTSLFNPLTNAWKLSVVKEFESHEFVVFYNTIGKILITTVALGTIFLGLISELIVKNLTASDFHIAWIYSPIILLSLTFVAFSAAIDPIFLVFKKSKYYLYSSIAGALIGVVANFGLVPIIGIWGATISLVLSHAAIAVTRLFFSEKYIAFTNKAIIFAFIFISIICNIIMVCFENYILSFGLFCVAVFFYYFTNRNQLIAFYNKIFNNYGKKY